MASANKNAKSQLFTVRVPHDVVSDMETVKLTGESSAGFIVAAMQGEIARRQMGGTAEDAIVSALETITHIRDGAAKAREELGKIIKMADKEIGE